VITFVTLPRAFQGEFRELQYMAIQSWLSAVPGCQVIVMGDEPGTRQAVYDLGIVQCLNVDMNEFGTPLMDKVFAAGEQYASHPWICEISADIVMDEMIVHLPALLAECERPFVIGQRWDIDPGANSETAKLHPPCGMDWFFYRRGTIGPIPPFAAGRGRIDNWLVWAAIHRWDMQVIDATEDVFAIHVNHGHPNWPNGKAGREAGPEWATNDKLAQETGMTRLYGINDAPWVLRNGHLLRREEANA